MLRNSVLVAGTLDGADRLHSVMQKVCLCMRTCDVRAISSTASRETAGFDRFIRLSMLLSSVIVLHCVSCVDLSTNVTLMLFGALAWREGGTRWTAMSRYLCWQFALRLPTTCLLQLRARTSPYFACRSRLHSRFSPSAALRSRASGGISKLPSRPGPMASSSISTLQPIWLLRAATERPRSLT